jgi:glycine reductase complex component B subunit gamma
MVKALHYLNQFFAGQGGEDKAGMGPMRIDGPVGPGRGLGLEIDVTLACGDDFFAEREDEALRQLLRWVDEARPDVVLCGPSFAAGRYGFACGALGREVARRGIAVVCAMHPDNPGVLAAEGGAYILSTGESVSQMPTTLTRMGQLASRLGRGEPIGSPEEEGYLPRGLRRNEITTSTGATRALEMLLDKLSGKTRTEVEADFDRVPPPARVPDLGKAVLALVTEAGCVPLGNPDGLSPIRARGWFSYPVRGVDSLSQDGYESVHGGFDTTVANLDPNRLVPLDAVRELEREGRIGKLHDHLFTTTGNGTPVASAVRFGREIGEKLRHEGVQAVLLTGT